MARAIKGKVVALRAALYAPLLNLFVLDVVHGAAVVDTVHGSNGSNGSNGGVGSAGTGTGAGAQVGVSSSVPNAPGLTTRSVPAATKSSGVEHADGTAAARARAEYQKRLGALTC